MRDEAFKRIGHLYPPIEITKEMVKERPDLKPYLGQKLTVIAWIWARTVRSPNPAFSHVEVPLASTFILSSKPGKEAWVQPVIYEDSRRAAKSQSYVFKVRVGKPPAEAKRGTKAARGANFRCLVSGVPIHGDYIKAEAVAGRMGQKLMAIVAEGTRGRVYLSPNEEHETIAKAANPKDAAAMIHVPLADDPRNLWCLQYGLSHFDHLFTPRQLVALTTFSDLVAEAREKIYQDAISRRDAKAQREQTNRNPSFRDSASLRETTPDDDTPLDAGGTGARAYAESVSVYLAFAANKCADYGCTIATWMPRGTVGHAFSKQAIPMTWDFPEANLLVNFHCAWLEAVEWVSSTIESMANIGRGHAHQITATSQTATDNRFISTDPPYFDNIGYADLSDFFYVWLRRSLRPVFPKLFATVSTPKAEELVASPYRHGSKEKAEKFFLDGMTQAMRNLAVQAHPAAPITIYYAFKQSETEKEGTISTGWETFLEAVLKSGLSITGTWPMRTERTNRSVAMGTNALASSIVLVCRPRPKDAGVISRRQFVRMLNETLPAALAKMTSRGDAETQRNSDLRASAPLREINDSPVAPVDLSQAIIGPGMAIFSRYEAVLEADGTPMTVRTALQLINRFLAEDDFDADTQFCLHWFEQHGWEAGKFGEADTLARAKGTSVDGVKAAGVIESGGGKVRLLRWRELDAEASRGRKSADFLENPRIPVWQVLHQMILSYNREGDSGAARIYAHPSVSAKLEPARQLAYRLYTLCERKGWAEDARAYNELVTGWSGIESAAARITGPVQGTLFEDAEENR
jgi:putative DNA methylase